jgi:hypothetical protein
VSPEARSPTLRRWRLTLFVRFRVKKGIPFEPRGTVQGFLDVGRSRLAPHSATWKADLSLARSCTGKVVSEAYTRASGYTLSVIRSYVQEASREIEPLLIIAHPRIPHIRRASLSPSNSPLTRFPVPSEQKGTGFYFSFYDSARHAIAQNPDIPLPQFITTFGCGSAAGLASWTLIYPLDLVKAKVQRNALADLPYEKPWAIFRRLSDNGFTRLYRGLGVSAARSIFTHGLMCELYSFFSALCTSLTL